MSFKNSNDTSSHLDIAIEEILSSINKKDNSEKTQEEKDPYCHGLVDIITFCQSPLYLSLPKNNFNIFLSQRVVLKCFYMGTPGNEKMTLEKEEWDWLYEKKQHKVIEKLQKRERGCKFRFSELTLVLGRRSSKTVMSSIIACYELYKLLVLNGGDPYTYFQIPSEHKIAVINVATSREQAKILFSEVESRIRNSPFFANRIAASSMTEIKLFTDMDLKKIEAGTGNIKVNGSVSVLCGHSNPKSLRGYAVFCLIFDEIAFYDEGGKVSARDFYNALQPSVMEFATSAIDGKSYGVVVEISSPGPTSGFFYKLWSDSQKEDFMLSFKTPTWDFNPKMPYDHPELLRLKERDPENFAVEFGAEWPEGSMYGQYFPKDLIDKVFEIGISHNVMPQDKPQPGGEYFFHIDPGLTASRYVCLAVQRVAYRDNQGVLCPRAVLSFIKTFTPITAMGLEWGKIDEEILRLCRLFRPMMVTYDQWNSASSLYMLQQNGIPFKQTSYNRGFKSRIYQNLREIMSKPECGCYLFEHDDLKNELYHLKYRPTPRGVSIGADKRGECPTDDICVKSDTIVCSNFSKEISEIAIGDEVLGSDGLYHKVNGIMSRASESSLVSIQPYHGFEIMVTPNHPIEVLLDEGRQWKRADEITKKDWIVFPYSIETINTDFDMKKYAIENVPPRLRIKNWITNTRVKDRNPNAKWVKRFIKSDFWLGYFCGIYLAEGALGDHSVAIAANRLDIKTQNKIRNVVNRVFGIKCAMPFVSEIHNGVQLQFNNNIMKKFVSAELGHYIAIHKSIPQWIMVSGKEFQTGFLRGYFDGDGCFSGGRYCFTTASKKMAIQLHQMLLKMGVVSNINVVHRAGKFSMLRGVKINHNADLYNIFITDAPSFNLMSHILGYKHHKEPSKWHKPKHKLASNFAAMKVFKIGSSDASQVVNLSVDDCHSFVANGISSHNCDCLAGATFSACGKYHTQLPRGGLVYTGAR